MDGLVHIDRYGSIFVASIRDCPRLDQANYSAFGEALVGHYEVHPGSHLLVSFYGVEFISSAVLSELIHARRIAEKAGGSVRICAMSPYVASVFEVTHLDGTFKAAGHVTDAAEAFIRDIEGAEV
jgi:anti-anti-sigma factor